MGCPYKIIPYPTRSHLGELAAQLFAALLDIPVTVSAALGYSKAGRPTKCALPMSLNQY